MPRIFHDLTEAVGHTPLVQVNRLTADAQQGTRVLAKLESFNPASSIKDRTALSIVRAAEADGSLGQGRGILEATSGNTGIALAWIGAVRGYRVVIVMPDDVSLERRTLIKALGAELVLTPGDEGMGGANQRAGEILEADPSLVLTGQGGNEANPRVHFGTTGPEIWDDTDGEVDVLVATTGTGGTISGAGRFLKQVKADIEVIGVEPAEAPVLSGGEWQPHKIQGITGGDGTPPVTDVEVIDRMVAVEQDQAIETSRRAARLEGLIVGISSGAALLAATRLAAEPAYAGKTIAAVLPDTGERYITSELFDHVR
ncbi:cysteine synthase A [Pseudoclavibacter sp. CFCC 13611]|uniref:cysteine synthase A n=1 Tax=Pseudoclavibacter sp. CFCC 13611 TaxID=2615178 RepID=UPI0013011BBC|nr:cysteine synthase A [Pseudoclavibacter sp. CFCC 13611]KAB1664449.1 cysteine synthase A [Pseudoclavibacter sp. CFCC 13611]